MKRVIITGPLANLSSWADAARAQGWDPVVFPLLEVRHRIVHLSLELDSKPDWIAVTSRNACRVLEEQSDGLLDVPVATVGRTAARRLEKAGYTIELEGAHSARDLAGRLLALEESPRYVLWPHGALSAELAERLRAGGVRVAAPVAYETNERRGTGPIPSSPVIFFASPSAVRAHTRRVERGEPLATCAVAIGPTTMRALESCETCFFPRVIELEQPRPEYLCQALVGIELAE